MDPGCGRKTAPSAPLCRHRAGWNKGQAGRATWALVMLLALCALAAAAWRFAPGGDQRLAALGAAIAAFRSDDDGQVAADTAGAADVRAGFDATPDPAVSMLLVRAGLLAGAGRIDLPPGDNALEVYRRVLAIDPRNRAARDAIAGLGTRAVEQAGAAAERGDFAGAGDLLRGAEAAEADPAAVARTRERIERLRASSDAAGRVRTEVEALVARADAARADGRLVPPAPDNALEFYRAALARDPGNAGAESGLNAIAARLLAEFDTALQAGDRAAAARALGAARTVRPDGAAVLQAVRRLESAPRP